MEKPVWVKVFGWMGLGAFVSSFLLMMGVTLTNGEPTDAATALAVGFFSLPCFFLWTVGTLLHRSRVHRARIQAAAFSELVARGPSPTVQSPTEDRRAAPQKFRSGPLGL